MKTQFLFILTLIPTTAFAVRGQKPPYYPDVIVEGPRHCRAPGPDECWDMTGQQRLKWVCNHCVNVGGLEKPKDPCVIEIHNLAKDFDGLAKGGPIQGVPSGTTAQACLARGSDRKYPLPSNFFNGLDSVAGAYDQGTTSASEAETGVASLAQTANDPQARICEISKKVNDKAAEAEDKLVDAKANLEFVSEYGRIGQAIDSASTATTEHGKQCFEYGTSLKKLKRRYVLIGKSCIGEAFATKKANVKKSLDHISSLKNKLKSQCLREQSLGDNTSAQNPAANESESTISEAK